MWNIAITGLISFCVLLSFSVYSWFIMWLIMEFLLIMVCSLLGGSAYNNESAMKYFLIQASSSLVYLFSTMSGVMLEYLFVLALLFKIGLVPFHFWVPHVFSGLSWLNIWVLSAVMKIPGLVLISHWESGSIWWVFMATLLVSGVGAMYCSNLKKLMGWSSIGHGGWMVVLSKSAMVWMTYFILYSFILGGCLFILQIYQAKNIFMLTKFNSSGEIFIIMLMILSLGGFPPFLGFVMKWMGLSYLLIYFGGVMVLFSVILAISLYFYFQIIIYSMMKLNYSIKMNTTPNVTMLILSVNLFGLIFGLTLL